MRFVNPYRLQPSLAPKTDSPVFRLANPIASQTLLAKQHENQAYNLGDKLTTIGVSKMHDVRTNTFPHVHYTRFTRAMSSQNSEKTNLDFTKS